MESQFDLKEIVFHNCPMPPSSNSQYTSFKRGGKIRHVSSPELMQFKRQMGGIFYKDPTYYHSCIKKIHYWIAKGYLLEVNCLFFFERSKLFTIGGKPRMMDVSNRIKAMHDGISQLIQVDDCYFFKITAEKLFPVMETDKIGTVSVEIFPYPVDH